MLIFAVAEWVPMVSLIASCIGLPTLAALIVTDIYRQRKEMRQKNSEENKRRKEQELQDAIRVVIQSEMKPLASAINELQADSTITKQSLQATLRHELYDIADKWKAKGFCPTQAKEDFENMYQKYHSLGNNGVMDTVREEIMSLPTSQKTKKSTNGKRQSAN